MDIPIESSTESVDRGGGGGGDVVPVVLGCNAKV